MQAKRLHVYCGSCNGYATPNALMITDKQTLCVKAFCLNCMSQVIADFSLSEMFAKSLQLSNLTPEPQANQNLPEMTEFDHKFLSQLRIKETPDEPYSH